MTYIRKTADILISDEIFEILKKFESKSLVAKLLLKTRHPKDYLADDFVNYISISKTDSTKISYLTSDRLQQVDPSEYWTTSRRFITKPGSFVRKVFKDIPAKEVEVFSNIFMLQAEKKSLRFDVVSGDAIKNWYSYRSYQSQGSSLGNSCMKHDSCQDFLNIYTENPEVCKMLVLLDDNNALVGRSLLWEFGGNKIMDRIYTINDDRYQHQFKDWANENGFIYKNEQRWNNSLWFESKDQKMLKEFEFELPNFDTNWSFPYVDTFKFINIKTGKLYNYLPESHRNIRTLIGSCGGYNDWDALAKDDRTNIFYSFHDTVHLEYCGLRVYNCDLKYSECNDRHILPEHAVWMEQIHDWIFNEDLNHLNNTDAIERRAKSIDKNIKGVRDYSDLRSLFGTIRLGGYPIGLDLIDDEVSITYSNDIPTTQVEL